MRKLKRAIARRKMIEDGWTKLNKKRAGKSEFAKNWKEYWGKR